MKKIVIIQRIIPHYRIPFYNALSDDLVSKGIELKVVYGQEYPETVPKSVEVEQDWAIRITNRYSYIFGKEIIWQPASQYFNDADLVVVEQANRLLVNYLLLLRRKFFGMKVAFWGHGKNFQAKKNYGFLESFKCFISINVDWWFAYTKKSARLVEAMGYDTLKITVVQNSIDTTDLKLAKKKISTKKIVAVKNELGINSDNVAIFCGGMYEEKKIEFLIEVCRRIRKKIPDFHMIFIGEGSDSQLVINFSKANEWVHYLGAITGNERVFYFAISKILLMPGLVGLAVLDSFVLEVPMVTTNIPIHSPEFEYLLDGINGLVTEFDINEYSKAVSALLLDVHKYSNLIEGCKISSEQYTVKKMAANFSEGLIKALDSIA